VSFGQSGFRGNRDLVSFGLSGFTGNRDLVSFGLSGFTGNRDLVSFGQSGFTGNRDLVSFGQSGFTGHTDIFQLLINQHEAICFCVYLKISVPRIIFVKANKQIRHSSFCKNIDN
jgi:hypothetical protein